MEDQDDWIIVKKKFTYAQALMANLERNNMPNRPEEVVVNPNSPAQNAKPDDNQPQTWNFPFFSSMFSFQ